VAAAPAMNWRRFSSMLPSQQRPRRPGAPVRSPRPAGPTCG